MLPTVTALAKGSKAALTDSRYTISLTPTAVDILAVLVTADGKVRNDSDLVFFNNPRREGVQLISETEIVVDLSALPTAIDRVIIAGSTEAQSTSFGVQTGVAATVTSAVQGFSFAPARLGTETVLQLVAFYRRDGRWRLDAIGQGYAAGLAAFAADHGIAVDDPATQSMLPQPPVPVEVSPEEPAAAPINFKKVAVTITQKSETKTATIDLRKNRGATDWVLTVGLWWDGRGARYDRDGAVRKFGKGDLDVYFFCRNEITNDYVVISGENGHRGSLDIWPHIHHSGDCRGPGTGGRPASEEVHVLPTENGDLLVNVYQAVANGSGALDTFGRPRVVIRYGRRGPDGLPGPDADEIVVHVGNGKNSYWATVAHIDVRDGILTVDGKTRYSRSGTENMPGLDSAGQWVREPKGGPIGRDKDRHGGLGLHRYQGQCAASSR